VASSRPLAPLSYSPSTISAQLSPLEREIGVPLQDVVRGALTVRADLINLLLPNRGHAGAED
jgi:hypothetical protein